MVLTRNTYPSLAQLNEHFLISIFFLVWCLSSIIKHFLRENVRTCEIFSREVFLTPVGNVAFIGYITNINESNNMITFIPGYLLWHILHKIITPVG